MTKTKEEKLATAKLWKERNKEHIIAKRKEYYSINKKREKDNNTKWLLENKEYWKGKKRELCRKWYAENSKIISNKRKTSDYRKKENDIRRNRYEKDPNYRERAKLRSLMTQAFRLQGIRKHQKSHELLGASIIEVRQHIESMFVDGMNWDNIHIDHIRPCASFDLSNPDEARKCFHYSNLQPLFAKDNLQKNSFFNGKYWRKTLE